MKITRGISTCVKLSEGFDISPDRLGFDMSPAKHGTERTATSTNVDSIFFMVDLLLKFS